MKPMFYIKRTLVPAFATAVLVSTSALDAASAETPLEAYRRAVRANDVETVSVAGRIARFETPNVAQLSLSMQELQDRGIHSLDLVMLSFGPQRLRARLLSQAAYSATVDNRDARMSPDLEADSFLVFNAAAPAQPLRLVGTGTSLLEAINGSAGMPFEIRVTRVRATPSAGNR